MEATNKNGLKIRTSNQWEIRATVDLLNEGFEVLRKGWPDLVAVKDGRIRLIEIKDTENARLKPHQKRIAQLLSQYGLEVEVWPQGNSSKARSWRAS